MPLSYFRRPLALAVLSWIALLCALKERGFFRVEVPGEAFFYSRLASVEVGARVLSGFAPKSAGDRFWVEITRVAAPPWAHTARWRALAYLPRADPDTARLRPGMRVTLEGRLRLGRRARNPGEFDERAFLERRGAALVVHARGVSVEDARVPPASRPQALAEAFHRSLRGHLQRRFPPQEASLLEGLLLGYKGPLGKLGAAVQDAGAMHLLVPSGAKVVFVLAPLAWLLRRPGVRSAAVAAVGGLYVLAAGADPPYTRAYLAVLAASVGAGLGRESGAFQGLALAAGLTLLREPRDLFSPGFAMTYAAVLALLVAMPRWEPPRLWPRASRRAVRALSAGAVVQAALWPALASVFGRGSRVGVLANLLLIPLSAPLMAAGFGSWALSFLPWSWPGRAAASAASGSVRAFAALCRAFAALPGAAVDLAPMGPRETAAYYAALAGALLLPQWRVSLAAWALAAGLWAAGPSPAARAVFLAGRRGSATLLALEGGRCLRAGSGASAGTIARAARVLGCDGPPRAAPAEGAEFERGPWRLELAGPEAGLFRGARMEYCIMASPTRNPRPECRWVRALSVRREGAVWVSFDGDHIHVTTQRRLGEVGRALP